MGILRTIEERIEFCNAQIKALDRCLTEGMEEFIRLGGGVRKEGVIALFLFCLVIVALFSVALYLIRKIWKRTEVDAKVGEDPRDLVKINQKFSYDEDEILCGSCSGKDNGWDFWIGCDICKEWFHGECVKISPAKAKSMEIIYKCPSCA